MRLDWDKYFIGIVDRVKERATCGRLSVGSLIVHDHQIISTGYNGSPWGEDHCIDVGCHMVEGSCKRTIHAEENAILQGKERGVRLSEATIYVTHFPCFECAKRIIQEGIKKVVYAEDYRNSAKTEEIFKLAGVEVNKVEVSK